MGVKEAVMKGEGAIEINKISPIIFLYASSSRGFSGQRDAARSHNFLSMIPIVLCFQWFGPKSFPLEISDFI